MDIPTQQAPVTPVEKEKAVTPQNDGSQIFGVSLRGIIAIILVGTVCLLSGFKIPVLEPLYTLVTMATGFYFGHTVGNKK